VQDGATHDTSRPTGDEARLTARGWVTAVAPEGGATRLQMVVIHGLTRALTDEYVEMPNLNTVEPLGPEEFAAALAHRDRAYRIRRVHTMILLELLLNPLPPEVVARVEAYADALGVGDDCRDLVETTRHLAGGANDLAVADFMRNGYEERILEREGTRDGDVASFWATVEDDPELAERWAALEDCPEGSLGRGVWQFYRARGFEFPGAPGSAPPHLAQHDWLHVLADYGTTVENEIEVFGLIARADDDPRSFSLLVAVLGLFESGFVERGLGLFEADPDHLSDDELSMGTRLADAIRRGGEVAWTFHEQDGIPLLDVDWFAHADRPLEEVRHEFGLDGAGARTLEARMAGSVGPFEPGGISPFQDRAGRQKAEAAGRPYESYGASPKG